MFHHFQKNQIASQFFVKHCQLLKRLLHKIGRRRCFRSTVGSLRNRDHMGKRPGDQNVFLTTFVPGTESGFDCNSVDFFELIFITGLPKHDPRGSVGIGGDDIGAGLNIIQMDFLKYVRIFQRNRTAPGTRDHIQSPLLQFGSRAPVKENDFIFLKFLYYIFEAHFQI